jgi:hypothetical protein
MTPAEVLDAAADLIEERGWWNGEEEQRDGFCAVTAITRIVTNEYRGWPRPLTIPELYEEMHLVSAAEDALATHVGATRVATWNDSQSAEVVVRSMRDCAAHLRGDR